MPLAGDDVVDQLDRALLADRERRHRLREDDRLLQRQDGQRRRGSVRLDGSLIDAPRVDLDRDALGPRRPLRERQHDRQQAALVASPSRRATSTSSASGIRRSNGPYSISICW